jgi:lysozyme
MATQEPTTIVTPGERSVEIPEQQLEVDNELQTPIVFGSSGTPQRIAFEGQNYSFPAEATDEQVLGFFKSLPSEEEVLNEEPPEPLREQAVIKKDEGVKKDKDDNHVSYRDTEKHLTGGRGHLLTKDERKLYPKGTIIPDEVVDAWFKEDMEEADATLTRILEKKAVHVPDEVYDILLNMSFNLGQKSLLTFKKMWAAIEVEDWATAAVEMEDSKWFKQVKNRAVRLVSRMASLGSKAPEEQTAMAPAKGGLFEDENGTLFRVDDQGNKTEV